MRIIRFTDPPPKPRAWILDTEITCCGCGCVYQVTAFTPEAGWWESLLHGVPAGKVRWRCDYDLGPKEWAETRCPACGRIARTFDEAWMNECRHD